MIFVKVPGVNGLGKTKGTRNAGNEILKLLNARRVEEIHVDNDNLPEQEKLIYENAKKLFEVEDKVIFLGGDHSVSYPLGMAFFEKFGEGAKIVIFDAHADCMKPMREPTHEEWLRGLIERCGILGDKVIIIGMCNVEKEEEEFLKEKGIRVTEDLEEVREFVSEGEIYVSFDIDVFRDVKATGYPEGEMKTVEIMRILDVVKEGNVRAVDLVEVNLEKEGLEESAGLGVKVLGKFL
jgi:arginase family enzyme